MGDGRSVLFSPIPGCVFHGSKSVLSPKNTKLAGQSVGVVMGSESASPLKPIGQETHEYIGK
ncbi:MAG TPA: hypothetical protein DHV49_06130 [Alphaproteobacteria bacterium]|nr:hypothetical protein [Alphaproteobacteria bacterium]